MHSFSRAQTEHFVLKHSPVSDNSSHASFKSMQEGSLGASVSFSEIDGEGLCDSLSPDPVTLEDNSMELYIDDASVVAIDGWILFIETGSCV